MKKTDYLRMWTTYFRRIDPKCKVTVSATTLTAKTSDGAVSEMKLPLTQKPPRLTKTVAALPRSKAPAKSHPLTFDAALPDLKMLVKNSGYTGIWEEDRSLAYFRMDGRTVLRWRHDKPCRYVSFPSRRKRDQEIRVKLTSAIKAYNNGFLRFPDSRVPARPDAMPIGGIKADTVLF